jgi:ubiquinone/menaquinone biosynthesis C-methylase UbiE
VDEFEGSLIVMSPQIEDSFNDAAAYDRYVGRWSREVAKVFIHWLDVPPEQIWLDVGAGTGILSEIIIQQARPTKVIGVDTSQVYIELAQERISDPRVQFHVGDANDLELSSIDFDVAVAGLVINFVPSPQRAVNNMVRMVKAGGLVAGYVWDYGDKMEMMRHFWDAAIKIDPSAAELDAGSCFTICHPDNLKSLFESAHLQTVEVIPIDIQTVFKDIDDYWQPFLAAQGSVSKYLRSLNQEARNAIREQLQNQLPIEEDGSIHLIARAWAVKGLT